MSGISHAEDAAPTVEEIKAADADFSKGRDAFNSGNFTEAAEFFESADNHAPNDRVIELAINAREQAGHFERAATNAQLALERYPDSARIGELVQPILVKANAELFRVTVTCDEPCSLLDGTRIVHGRPGERRVIYLSPGAHTIRAGWSEDRAESKGVEGKAGGSAEITFEAPPIPEKPAADPIAPPPGDDVSADRPVGPPPSGISPVVFWVGAGLTAVAGGVTIWSGVDTLNNPGKEKVQEECAGQGTSCSLYQKGKDKELRTNILLGATGALGVATIVVGAFFTNWSGGDTSAAGPGSRTASTVLPWIEVGDGAKLGASGRF